MDGLDLRVEAVEDSKDLDLSKEYSTTMYKLRGYRDGKEVKALEKELVVHFPLLKKNFNGIYELGPDTHKREKFDYNEKNNVKYISLTINSLNDFLLTFDFADSNGMVQAEKSDKPVLNNDNQGTSSDVRDDHMEKNVADNSGDNGCIEHSKDEESESKSPNKSYPKTSDSGVGTYEAVVVIAIVTLALMKKIKEKDIKESK